MLDDPGQVTAQDLDAAFTMVRANLPSLGFNPTGPAQPSGAGVAAVPEPGTIGLLAAFALFDLVSIFVAVTPVDHDLLQEDFTYDASRARS